MARTGVPAIAPLRNNRHANARKVIGDSFSFDTNSANFAQSTVMRRADDRGPADSINADTISVKLCDATPTSLQEGIDSRAQVNVYP